MKDNFLYVIGTNPYDDCHGDYRTRGNGEWHTIAGNLQEAFQVIFGSMSFPGELLRSKIEMKMNQEQQLLSYYVGNALREHARKEHDG